MQSLPRGILVTWPCLGLEGADKALVRLSGRNSLGRPLTKYMFGRWLRRVFKVRFDGVPSADGFWGRAERKCGAESFPPKSEVLLF